MTCNQCFHWNTPLHMRALYVVDAGPVPLSFGQWILYHLHVATHQRGQWQGEIEEYSAQLKAEKAGFLKKLLANTAKVI